MGDCQFRGIGESAVQGESADPESQTCRRNSGLIERPPYPSVQYCCDTPVISGSPYLCLMMPRSTSFSSRDAHDEYALLRCVIEFPYVLGILQSAKEIVDIYSLVIYIRKFGYMGT